MNVLLRRRLDTVLVDFDRSCTVQTKRALLDVGASVEVCSAEDLTADSVRDCRPRSLVLAASSLDAPNATIAAGVLDVGVPILGICNGAQIIARGVGGGVGRAEEREDGITTYQRTGVGMIERYTPRAMRVRMHHEYVVTALPSDARVLGSTPFSPIASFEIWRAAPMFGVQFHPEEDLGFGRQYLSMFLGLSRCYSLLGGCHRRGWLSPGSSRGGGRPEQVSG